MRAALFFLLGSFVYAQCLLFPVYQYGDTSYPKLKGYASIDVELSSVSFEKRTTIKMPQDVGSSFDGVLSTYNAKVYRVVFRGIVEYSYGTYALYDIYESVEGYNSCSSNVCYLSALNYLESNAPESDCKVDILNSKLSPDVNLVVVDAKICNGKCYYKAASCEDGAPPLVDPNDPSKRTCDRPCSAVGFESYEENGTTLCRPVPSDYGQETNQSLPAGEDDGGSTQNLTNCSVTSNDNSVTIECNGYEPPSPCSSAVDENGNYTIICSNSAQSDNPCSREVREDGSVVISCEGSGVDNCRVEKDQDGNEYLVCEGDLDYSNSSDSLDSDTSQSDQSSSSDSSSSASTDLPSDENGTQASGDGLETCATIKYVLVQNSQVLEEKLMDGNTLNPFPVSSACPQIFSIYSTSTLEKSFRQTGCTGFCILGSDLVDGSNEYNVSLDTHSIIEAINNNKNTIQTSVDTLASKIDTTNSKLDNINAAINNVSSKIDVSNEKLSSIDQKLDTTNQVLTDIKDVLKGENINPDEGGLLTSLDSFANDVHESFSKLEIEYENLKSAIEGKPITYQKPVGCDPVFVTDFHGREVKLAPCSVFTYFRPLIHFFLYLALTLLSIVIVFRGLKILVMIGV